MKSRIVQPAASFQPPDTCTEHEECQAAQTPLEDLRKIALEHYEKVTTVAHEWHSVVPKAINAYFDDLAPVPQPPINMILFCPRCGTQHVDAEEDETSFRHKMEAWSLNAEWQDRTPQRWTNPPHRSHLCHQCGAVWRPADVPTNGVERTQTRGAEDNTWTNTVAAPASVQPPMPPPTGEEAALNALAGMGFMGGVMNTLIKRIAIVVNSAIARQKEVDASALCDWCARGNPVSFLNQAFRHRLEGETPWVVCRANAIRAAKQQ